MSGMTTSTTAHMEPGIHLDMGWRSISPTREFHALDHRYLPNHRAMILPDMVYMKTYEYRIPWLHVGYFPMAPQNSALIRQNDIIGWGTIPFMLHILSRYVSDIWDC